MDRAINSQTKKYIYSISLELDGSYQFLKEDIWYADPNDIESYDKEKVKDVRKIEVKYRKGNDQVINWNGTEYSIAPCFYIHNKTKLGINLIPESREHKLVKNWIYNKLKNKKLSFVYSTVTKPYEYNNKINIKELDVDYEKIGIETTVKNNKVQRADIIVPLKKYSELWGTGIVIEIQFSKQYDSTTYKRNNDWAFKGYSVCWLWDYDFENITSELIELKKEGLKIETIGKILHEFSERNLQEFKSKTQELSRMIDKKMDELNFPFVIGECKQCDQGYVTKKTGKFGEFYGCSNFRNGCKHIIKIEK